MQKYSRDPLWSHLPTYLIVYLWDKLISSPCFFLPVCKCCHHVGCHIYIISEWTSLAIWYPTYKVESCFRTGRELYDLLKARNGVNNPYESLTAREKHFYGRAVCAIKKDYVKKYKEYLESLSPRQLFDHYMKIF